MSRALRNRKHGEARMRIWLGLRFRVGVGVNAKVVLGFRVSVV